MPSGYLCTSTQWADIQMRSMHVQCVRYSGIVATNQLGNKLTTTIKCSRQALLLRIFKHKPFRPWTTSETLALMQFLLCATNVGFDNFFFTSFWINMSCLHLLWRFKGQTIFGENSLGNDTSIAITTSVHKPIIEKQMEMFSVVYCNVHNDSHAVTMLLVAYMQ